MSGDTQLYLLFLLFAYIVGTVVGSFLNVVILRLQSKKSIVKGRSACPGCGIALHAHELIPLVSFLVQRGRCKQCKEKISWQYPLVELTTGVAFALGYALLPAADSLYPEMFLILAVLWAHLSILIVLCVSDLLYYRLPNAVMWPGIILAFLGVLYSAGSLEDVLRYGVAALIASGFFLFLYLISKGKWIGFGDVKLGLYLGLLVGWPEVIFALLFSFILGALVAVFLISIGKRTWGQKVPFGVFLTISVPVTWLIGTQATEWYRALIGL